jgi:transposase
LDAIPVTATVVKEHIRHKHGRSPLPEHLPRIDHMLDIAEDKKVCVCPDNSCDACGVRQAPPPEGPIERCEADAGMLAHVIVEKYEHNTPLTRQAGKLERQNVPITRGTLCGWMV